MLGRVTIDLNRRTVGRAGLLWNRLTPTRGAKITNAALYGLAFNGQTKVTVSENALLAQSGERQIELPSSQYYARCLCKAGVIEFELPSTTTFADIKDFLDVLTDKSYEAAKAHLMAYSKVLLKPEADLETAKSPDASPDKLRGLFHEYLTYYDSTIIYWEDKSFSSYALRPAVENILRAVIENPNTPNDVLEKADTQFWLWGNLARNPWTPENKVAALIAEHIEKTDGYTKISETEVAYNGSMGEISLRSSGASCFITESSYVQGKDYDVQLAIEIVNSQPVEKRARIIQYLAEMKKELHDRIVAQINI